MLREISGMYNVLDARVLWIPSVMWMWSEHGRRGFSMSARLPERRRNEGPFVHTAVLAKTLVVLKMWSRRTNLAALEVLLSKITPAVATIC